MQDDQLSQEDVATQAKIPLDEFQALAQEPLAISPGDWVKVVRGEGEGSTGVVYKVKDNGHLKVCLGNSLIVPHRPEAKTTGWGHDTSHCAKVIEAADRDLQETEESLKRKIVSIELAEREMKRINRHIDSLLP